MSRSPATASVNEYTVCFTHRVTYARPKMCMHGHLECEADREGGGEKKDFAERCVNYDDDYNNSTRKKKTQITSKTR